VLEDRVRKLSGNPLDVVHVAEAGTVDQLVAAARELAEHPLRIRSLRHGLDELRLHLAVQRFLHLPAAEVVLKGPAGLADRADVDEADLQRLGALALRARRQARSSQRAGGRRPNQLPACQHGSDLHQMR
jgi:hypothetical protein